jgi:hypothetical protein
MAVLIAEDVNQGLSTNERAQLELFEANPGRGGQRVTVEISSKKLTVNHVTYGRGEWTVTIFYNREGEDYKIVGIGVHDGVVSGKTAYKSRWTGRTGRVKVIITGT